MKLLHSLAAMAFVAFLATPAHAVIEIVNQTPSQSDFWVAVASHYPAANGWKMEGWRRVTVGTSVTIDSSDAVIALASDDFYATDLIAAARAAGYPFPYESGSFWGTYDGQFKSSTQFNGSYWPCPAVTIGEIFYPAPSAPDNSATCSAHLEGLGMTVLSGLRIPGDTKFTVDF